MEMSTLTTNSINEQFMSTVTELNNNNNICANGSDTTSTCSSSQGSKIASSNGSTAGENETTNPNHSDADSPAHVVQTILSQPDPSPEPVLPTEEPDSLLLPPLIEMPSDPNQGNEMLQNLPKDTSISFPDVSAQTLDENQDVKMVLPEFTDPTSLLNPNAASLTTDPLRTPPRPMIEDRTTVTDQFIAVAPPAASAPPVVTVQASDLEPEMKEKEPEPTVDCVATSVKQEPSDGSMNEQLEKLDEKVEGLIRRSKLDGSPNQNGHQLGHSSRTAPMNTTNPHHVPGYQSMSHHHHLSAAASQIHPVPVSRPPVSHPYGGHHYFPRPIPSHISDHPSAYPLMDPSHGLHHHRYSSAVGQVPFHHQSSMSEDDSREEDTPSPSDSREVSALNLAMNAAAYQNHHQLSQQQHYPNIGTISQQAIQPQQQQQQHSSHGVPHSNFSNHLHQQQQSSSSALVQQPGTVHHLNQGHHQHVPHFQQAHHQAHQPMSQAHHHFPPHHQLPPGRNPYHSTPPPPLISSLASSMSRNSGNSLTYNQADNGAHNEPFHVMSQHLPPPNHHPFADPAMSSSHHVMGPGYRPPTSIPVSVVTSLSEIRRKQSLINPVQYNTLVNGSSIQEYKLFHDQNKPDNMRAVNHSSITVKTRTALPSSVITTGTRSSARTNTMTGVHEGGAGGITGSNDLVSAISGQPSGPAGGVSCTPMVQSSGSNRHRVAPIPVIGPRPPPLESGNPAKPFKCPLCGKELASKNVYQLHLRSHSGERPFACNLCGNAFSQKTSLTRHMRSHTGERPYPCQLCSKRFADKERIKIHMRTHTGEKPFSCGVCSKTFSQKSTVKRHMSVHTGAKPYKCPQCDKGFANRGNLTAHTKTHQPQNGQASNLGQHPRSESASSSRHNSGEPPRFSRGSGSYVSRHPSGSSVHSMSSSENSEVSVANTNGTLVIDSPNLHRQDTQGSNSSQSSSVPVPPPPSVMVAK